MAQAEASAPWSVAVSGLAALALAMGIGRFAFTPILPMMQADLGVTVAQGGWLASANYAGYLIGALSAMRGDLRPRFAIRAGLIVTACATIAMGFEHRFLGWLILRALAGLASAWVLVYVSAWALEKLAHSRRADLAGMLYAGVGAGLVFVGAACFILLQAGASSATAWVVLGLTAVLITAVLWNVLAVDAKAASAQVGLEASPRDVPEFWRLVLCYGAFGLGYIIPATFLPAMARQLIADPAWFGWAWPVFGAAAVLSTLLASRASLVIGQRAVWILANVVMAVGVLVPIVLPGMAGIVIAAVCVGGTFVVNTMVGMQEARRVAGAHARMLMAAMTSAFAVGQIVGPMLVSWLVRFEAGFSFALAAAAIPLFLAAYALFIKTEQNDG
jgi:predicted MFS family arabinose efflux permease